MFSHRLFTMLLGEVMAFLGQKFDRPGCLAGSSVVGYEAFATTVQHHPGRPRVPVAHTAWLADDKRVRDERMDRIAPAVSAFAERQPYGTIGFAET